MMLRVTELADRLMQRGFFEVYEATPAVLEKLLGDKAPPPSAHGDSGAAEPPSAAGGHVAPEAGAEAPAPVAAPAADAAVPALDEVMWEYRLGAAAEGDVHGPFANSAMLAWQQQGYFAANRVFVRRTGRSGDFGPADRIDFEMYE